MLDPGATVVGVSRNIQQSQFSSSSFVAPPAEISSGQGATAVIDTVIARFGKLDAVIHQEGGFAGGKAIADPSADITENA